MPTDIAEEHDASIFKVEQQAKQETSMKQVASMLEMEATCFSDTSVDFQRTALYPIRQNSS
jgi:hypothetical protein